MSSGRCFLVLAGTALALVLGAGSARAQEAMLTDEQVKKAVAADVTAKKGKLSIAHPETGKPLELTFVEVHEGVMKTPGGRYAACVDFKDAKGKVYDVDYYVDEGENGLVVEDRAIHKVGGKAVQKAMEKEELQKES